ncbi:MAG: hypothetical protein RLY97_1332, partial [Pseudomonadota bacterium]
MCVEIHQPNDESPNFVIPAKAGIHLQNSGLSANLMLQGMDPRLPIGKFILSV